jgi:hypothetical protein
MSLPAGTHVREALCFFRFLFFLLCRLFTPGFLFWKIREKGFCEMNDTKVCP